MGVPHILLHDQRQDLILPALKARMHLRETLPPRFGCPRGQVSGAGCKHLGRIVLEAAHVTEHCNLQVKRQESRERRADPLRCLFRVAETKDRVEPTRVGALEVTHVLIWPRYWHLHLLSHVRCLADNHARQILWTCHWHDTQDRQ